MAAGDKATPPSVSWAQRNDKVFLTINIEDCQSPDIQLTETTLTFKGKGGPHAEDHAVELEFYGELDTAKSKYVVNSRNIPMVLFRKEEGPYWPRLLKSKTKVHWLKTDFDKWKDEDETDEEDAGMMGMGGPGMGGPGGMDLSSMMANMGNFNAEAPPGDEDGGKEEEEDSDDEDMPDLQ
ncbi:co-chaperone protein daf-41-like [Watersipora subatra]|uniref:co-chaperone protein daf-41-like n=1 Tax=Watersipora subatra TaxID=2589382 RepID=UPI00355BF5ED